MNFTDKLIRCQSAVEEALAGYFKTKSPQHELYDSMRYSLLAGGKRIRPVLVLQFCEAAGGDPQKALPIACAVEMLHTYSLVHDDLPCMDNDDLRRGKPTNHKVFGECTATLAGDALQTAAFQTILSTDYSPEIRCNCALALSEAVGADGMCGGQILDREGERRTFTLEEVAQMNALKTGRLLRCACELGVFCAGVAVGSPEHLAAKTYADSIGLAFQVRDDMLNITSSPEVMGKPVGNDAEMGKSTFVSLLGLDACAGQVRCETEKAKAAINAAFTDTSFLVALADYLAGRAN